MLTLVFRLFEQVGIQFVCQFDTGDVEDPTEVNKRPPITVKFEIPYFTVSGIQVRYLKVVEKSGYQALPWVRYITQNGGMLFLLAIIMLTCCSS